MKEKSPSQDRKKSRSSLSPGGKSFANNPDQILERILDTITSNPEYQKPAVFSRTRSKEMIDSESTTKYHFNKSIFNNFRMPKKKGSKMLESLYKTLEIN